jgi:hypothetical protein
MYRWLSFAVVALSASLGAVLMVSRGGGGAETPAARVEEHGGTTVVFVTGPPRAKGRSLGLALRDRIGLELRRALPEDPGTRDFVVRTGAERLSPFLPPEYREEIEGIAEGSGISFDEALFLNTRFELSAHNLAPFAADVPEEGAVGPGPFALCLFAPDAARDLVVVVHEDREPPLWLVARPGMAGGFLGLRGNVAAAMRPMRSETPPGLHGLVWTLLVRRLLEDGRSLPESTGGISVAMALPDGSAATVNVAAHGATSYAAGGGWTLTTDEAVGERGSRQRDPKERARILAEARALLDGRPPAGRTLFGLRGGEAIRLTVAQGDVRRELPLDGPPRPPP